MIVIILPARVSAEIVCKVNLETRKKIQKASSMHACLFLGSAFVGAKCFTMPEPTENFLLGGNLTDTIGLGKKQF